MESTAGILIVQSQTNQAMPYPARIAYLVGEYPAVSHTFILREVLALRADGLDVLTCSIRRTGPEHQRGPEESEAARNTFYVIHAAKNPLTLLGSVGWALARPRRLWRTVKLAFATMPAGLKAAVWQMFYLIEAMVLARHLTRQGIGHLHNHFATASCSVAMLTSELSGVPFSFTLHGPVDFLETRHWRLDEKIARAGFVACISHFCRSQGMLFSDPAHWPRLCIIHCGVIPERYATRSGHVPGRNILFVGRLAAEKGVPLLLEAFARAREAYPDACLTLVGDGPERTMLEARVRELGLQEVVRFTGYLSQQEVAGELAQADLFVLPSFSEGLPVVLMEAMATGLPVLTTGIAGVPELVEEGVTGRVVFPGDVVGLEAGMRDLLADPQASRQLGQQAKAKVAAEFDARTEAGKLAALFRAGA